MCIRDSILIDQMIKGFCTAAVFKDNNRTAVILDGFDAVGSAAADWTAGDQNTRCLWIFIRILLIFCPNLFADGVNLFRQALFIKFEGGTVQHLEQILSKDRDRLRQGCLLYTSRRV